MLPNVPFKGVDGFHPVPFTGTEDSQHIVTDEDWVYLPPWDDQKEREHMTNEDWVYLPPRDDQKEREHMHSHAIHVWPSTAMYPPLSPAHSMNTGAMPPSKESEAVSLGAKPRSLLPAAVKLEQEHNMMMENKFEDELDSQQMPGLKRTRTMTLSTSENAPSMSSLGVMSPMSPDPSSLSDSSDPHGVVRSIDLMHPPMPPPRSFSSSPFDAPSPLGLTLRKSPSLLQLIQRKLAQGDVTLSPNSDAIAQQIASKARKCNTLMNGQQDKLKASNFPASILRIGTWERASRYEGDLVAKCYYAKRKLVWEVLDSGLKSKIEIQWSDITALEAHCQENEPGVLEIEVSRLPLFFKETNPQPRKHTLWQATSDFTGGQATICKQHYLQFSPGMLNRHYEKLMQCDPRLKSLSENAVSSRCSLYSEHQNKKIEGQHEQQFQLPPQGEMHSVVQYGSPGRKHLPPFSSLQMLAGNSAVLGGSMAMHHTGIVPKFEPVESEDRFTEWPSKGVSSSSTARDSQCDDDSSSTDRGGFHSVKHMVGSGQVDCMSTSAAELLDQRLPSNMLLPASIETQTHSCSVSSAIGYSQSSDRKILNEIAYHLLGEPLLPAASDEQTNAARLNLRSSLLQMDIQHLPTLPSSYVSAGSVPFSYLQQGVYNSFQELNHYEQLKARVVSMESGGMRPPSRETVKNPF